MKRIFPLWLALCLLLCGCGEAAVTPAAKPTAPPVAFTPHYSDYAARGMTATVQSAGAGLPALGMLNNLYQDQAKAVYEILNPTAFYESYLSLPEGTPYIQVVFRPYSDPEGETYTIYENDLVLAHHPSADRQVCTAPAGTYNRLHKHLTAVQKKQRAYFTLDFSAQEQNSYTLYHRGKKWLTQRTGAETATLDLVKAGVVRVTEGTKTYFCDTAARRKSAAYNGLTDLYGDRLAVAEKAGVSLYTLFDSRPDARVYVAGKKQQIRVQGMAFSENGKQLHVVCAVGEAVYDRTFKVATLLKGKIRYMMGDWEAAGGHVTEDIAQSVGYRSLKKLRHKEAELGYNLSAIPLYKYDLDGVTYYLTELGHWTVKGGQRTYAVDGYLMVRRDLSAGYKATLSEDELSWNTDKDWFKQ